MIRANNDRTTLLRQAHLIHSARDQVSESKRINLQSKKQFSYSILSPLLQTPPDRVPLFIMNASCIHIQRRFARHRSWKCWPNDWLPFTWKRPEQQPGYFDTGDQVEGVEPLDPKLFRNAAVAAAYDELKDVPEEVRRQFTFEFTPRKQKVDQQIEQSVLRHSKHLDHHTLAGSVARMTYRIRNSRFVLRNTPNDVLSKINICWWSDKRLKRMIDLHKFDRNEFDRLMKELKVNAPQFVLDGKLFQRIERKRELRRLTDEYCQELKKEKLDAYHQQLKEQQQQFLKEKQSTEEWVEEQTQQLIAKKPVQKTKSI